MSSLDFLERERENNQKQNLVPLLSPTHLRIIRLYPYVPTWMVHHSGAPAFPFFSPIPNRCKYFNTNGIIHSQQLNSLSSPPALLNYMHVHVHTHTHTNSHIYVSIERESERLDRLRERLLARLAGLCLHSSAKRRCSSLPATCPFSPDVIQKQNFSPQLSLYLYLYLSHLSVYPPIPHFFSEFLVIIYANLS